MSRKKKCKNRYFAILFRAATKGLPLDEVAKILCVDRRTVFYWLEGKIAPTFDDGCEVLNTLAKTE